MAELDSVEVTPVAGTSRVNGTRVETTPDQVDAQVDATRKAWEQAHPAAKEGTGPYPFMTIVTLRRHGAPVRQALLVKFADGTRETVVWDDTRHWARYSWVKPARAVSAELDPEQAHYMDVSKLDDSLTLAANRAASTRWAVDFGAVWQLILTMIASIV